MTLSEYLAKIGSAGGRAGTGKSKRRGSKAYYKALAAKAAKARKAKQRCICGSRVKLIGHKRSCPAAPWASSV